MDSEGAEQPRHYSQVAAQAMHRELERQSAEIRRLEKLLGLLNREAEQQATTITQLREDAAHWRTLYMQASLPGSVIDE